MDPMSIAAGSVSIAGGVAKASFAIVDFLNHFKDAAGDLNAVNKELNALTAVVNPLARTYAEAPSGIIPPELAEQLQLSLEGCDRLVGQIAATVEKYQQDGAWTKAKWVLFGRGDMDKLRSGLEAYKMALSIGLHAISITVGESIEKDTGALRKETRALRKKASAIHIDTREILARVTSLQNGAEPLAGDRTAKWVASMSILTSYAESASQDTTLGSSNSEGTLSSATSYETLRPEKAVLNLADKGLETIPESLNPVERPASRTKLKRASSTLTPSRPNSSMTWTFTPAASDALDLVVAIDLGSTSAAVAWSTHGSTVTFIKDWPGGSGQRVPITVAYNEDNTLSSWGFKCREDDRPGKTHHICSERMDLDQSHYRSWLEDYVAQLYAYVRDYITSALILRPQDWEKMGIEFHFTLSDLFRASRSKPSLDGFKDLIRRSGFGTGGPRHCSVLGMTETEAAAANILSGRSLRTKRPISAFLNIGLTHATIVRAKEVGASSQYVTEAVCIPGLEAHVEKTVTVWLKRDCPRISEQLGEGGVGRLIWDSGFRDLMGLLDGSVPSQASYRLRFERIPRSIRHKAYDLRDGTMRFNRWQVECILDPLVDEIRQLVVDALKRVLSAEEQKLLQVITTLKTVDTQLYLLERVGKAIGKLQNDTPDPQLDANTNPAENSNRDMRLSAVSATFDITGHRDHAALRGIFAQRAAWASDPLINLQYPQDDAHLRIHIDGSRSIPIVRDNIAGDITQTSPLTPFSPIKRRFEVVDLFIKPDTATMLVLDIYLTRKTGVHYKKSGAGQEQHLTRLCTASWALRPEDFLGKPWGKRWYRVRKSGTLWCDLRLDLLRVERAGPGFELRIAPGKPRGLDLLEGERPAARMPERVEWDCEPPYMVWPLEMAW